MMRASKKSGTTISHLLSVVSHELGVTLTQQGVSGKTNEISISTEVLNNIDVRGKVITTAGLFSFRHISCFLRKSRPGGRSYRGVSFLKNPKIRKTK